MARPRRRVPHATELLLALLLIAGSLAVVDAGPASATGEPRAAVPVATASGSLSPAVLASEPREPVAGTADDAAPSGSVPLSATAVGSLSVLVTFGYTNSSELASLLAGLTDPSSPQYHDYLTAAEFDAEFAPAPSTYAAAVAYFGAEGARNLTSYPDRLALTFDASPSVASAAFGTTIETFAGGGGTYLAPSSPITLPTSLASVVVGVEGLRSDSASGAGPGVAGGSGEEPSASDVVGPSDVAGYLAPPTVDGVQYEYLPDLQVANDELSLFDQYGFPQNETVAAIVAAGEYTGTGETTSCGTLTSGEDVGPWVSTDLTAYDGETLPSGEPDSPVVAVPVSGASLPGCLASWDTTGTVLANTAELEAIASTAPGASIYGVYGPTWASADAAFATILSPPSTLSAAVRDGLDNVSVVSTAYAVSDRNDTSWMTDLEQAQARGITVLAATGNAGDNPKSSAWTNTTVEFPASMAYSKFGDVAVGGETITLNPSNLTLATADAWNISSSDTSQGGPLGTEGGVSSVFTSEPSWQASSPGANAVIDGLGRAVPDLSAIANNTLVTVTVDGIRYDATNASATGPFKFADGTGIAVSVTAGLVAEIDFVLEGAGTARVGFFDPELYALADEEYAALPSGSIKGTTPGTYNASLPTLPLRDVTAGRNDLYVALPGYDLLTGWGSLDAYNTTMYLFTVGSAGIAGRLQEISDKIALNGLAATTTLPGGATDTAYNASVQQSFYLANSFGAPVYGVRSLVLIARDGSDWTLNFTGWVSFPFSGLYPNLTVSEFWWPQPGETLSLPVTMNLTTSLVPAAGSTPPEVKFSFGVTGTSNLTLSVPGAAYILGSTNDSYSWQGTTYSNGPKGSASPLGYLAPQCGIEGGPTGGSGDFGRATAGTVEGWVEPYGGSKLVAATTANVSLTETHNPETAANLTYHENATVPNDWSFSSSPGGAIQGISEVGPAGSTVTWKETGLPSSATWFVTLPGGVRLLSAVGGSTIVASLVSGSYAWTAAVDLANWSASPDTGTVTPSGSALEVDLTIYRAVNTVTFTATGPTFPFDWSVTIAGIPELSGSTSTLSTSLAYGKYTYTAADTAANWEPESPTGSFTIGSTPTAIPVAFSLVTFPAEIYLYPPTGVAIYCTVTIGNHSSTEEQQTYTAHLPNGTYNWSVSNLPAGDHAHPSSGQFVIKGARQTASVTITGPARGLFGLGLLGYGLLGAAAAVVIVGVLLLRPRRTPPRPPKPRPRDQTWQPGGN